MRTETNRRIFLQDASISAAALTSLAATLPNDAIGGLAPRREGTPFICVTCASQFAETQSPPERCPICDDERQYVPPGGQQWTTLDALRGTHKVVIKAEEEGLHSVNAEPKFGIGQRAFLIRTPAGNVLWDCVAPLDDAAIAQIKGLGGLEAIAVSHPHYYATMVEWSRAFGDIPIHLHEAERKWVMRPDPCVRFWSDRPPALPGGLALVRTTGHFEGYQVLHWPAGAGGRGVLLAGDQPQICMDPKQVSFMYSYPNYIPLDAPTIRHILACLESLPFDRIYGAFFLRGSGIVPALGKEVVRRSAERYLRAIRG